MSDSEWWRLELTFDMNDLIKKMEDYTGKLMAFINKTAEDFNVDSFIDVVFTGGSSRCKMF